MRGRKLTQEQRDAAMAMLRAGKSYRMISDALSISIGAVHSIARGANESDITRMVSEIKRGYIARHLMLADYMLDELTRAVNSSTGVRDLAIAAAILTDKAMQLEGMEEKRQKARTLALQIGAPVPPALPVPVESSPAEPVSGELDTIHDTLKRPDNARTMQMIKDVKGLL